MSEKSFIFDRIKNNHPFTPRIPNENQKSNCIKIGGSGVDDLILDNKYLKIDKQGNIKGNQNKASCFTAGGHSGGNHSDMDLIVHNTMPRSSTSGKGGTGHLSRNDGKTYCLDTGNTNAVDIKRQIITHNIPEIVNVRKYEVNILELQKTLKQHKKLNNQQIADNLNVPKTMVEHWFRTDNYFSIPDKDIWIN